MREKHREEQEQLEKTIKDAKRKVEVLETVVREERGNYLVKEQEFSVEVAGQR